MPAAYAIAALMPRSVDVLPRILRHYLFSFRLPCADAVDAAAFRFAINVYTRCFIDAMTPLYAAAAATPLMPAS